jgi:hypothetical protein
MLASRDSAVVFLQEHLARQKSTPMPYDKLITVFLQEHSTGFAHEFTSLHSTSSLN